MIKKLLSILVFSFLFYSCADEKEIFTLDLFLEEIKIEPQLFYTSTDSMIRVKGQKGTTLTIDPNNIDFQNGEMPKEIRVELIELTTTEELLRHNVQTVSNGKWLISGGSFKISLFEKEKPLSLKNGKTISAVFPKIRNENMQLFYGERGEFGEMNWDPENQFFEEELYFGMLETHEITEDVARNLHFGVTGFFNDDLSIDTLGYSTLENHKRFFEEREVDSISIIQDTIRGYFLIKTSEGLTNQIWDSWGSFYQSIEINQLGWINIGLFYPEIENRASCEIILNVSLELVKLYVIDRSNNTVVNIFPNNNYKYIVDLPKNIEFDIIAIGSKGKSFFSSRKTVQVLGDEVLELKMQKVNENDITDIFK
jgi:hypothetical protein